MDKSRRASTVTGMLIFGMLSAFFLTGWYETVTGMISFWVLFLVMGAWRITVLFRLQRTGGSPPRSGPA